MRGPAEGKLVSGSADLADPMGQRKCTISPRIFVALTGFLVLFLVLAGLFASGAATAETLLPTGDCSCGEEPKSPETCRPSAEPIRGKAQECRRLNPQKNDEIRKPEDCGGNMTCISDYRAAVHDFHDCKAEVDAFIAACKGRNSEWMKSCEQARRDRC